jgi:diguanylate cyclase (GGDEF)-like protein
VGDAELRVAVNDVAATPTDRAIAITDQDRADARASLHETSGPVLLWSIVGSVTLVVVTAFVGRIIQEAVFPGLDGVAAGIVAAVTAAVLAAPLLAIVGHLANNSGINTNAEQLARDRLMHVAAQRREFETRVANAFEMSDSEPDALEVTERALAHVVPDAPAELLLADNSHAHLVRVAVSSGNEAPGCRVDSPQGCVAARRGQTMVFPDSDELDACPKLRDRPTGACAAVCVPVSIMGRSVGVVHVTKPRDEEFPVDAGEDLQVLANQVGNRIGMLRMMAETQLQASTDGLTGLLNRRSLENKVRELRRLGTPFALVMADLDHFKRLNDTYGHDAGDRALRIFSETLRTVVRPDDLVCRYGGEEFAIVLPDCSVAKAVEVMDRARAELAATGQRGDCPPFTASFGVVGGEPDEEFEELVARADASLYRAKDDGRNRVVVDGQHGADLGPLFARNGKAAVTALDRSAESA